jgi:hypothetical protein
MVILYESTFHFLVGLFFGFEFLLMEEFKNIIDWQHQIYAANANADNRLPSNRVPNLRVKNQLSDCPQHKGKIHQLHSLHA